jgi:molybdopterin synthase catalytic subunit/molybdopterin synthase sulfur carrier subunit
MKVAVKLFAAARELAGGEEVEIELRAGACAKDARAALAQQYAPLAPLVERSLLAVNAEYVDGCAVIQPGDELALIPPVSGG